MTEVQNPQQFLSSFLDHAAQAKKHIYLQSLLFEYGEFLTKCEPIFIEKAKAGIPVEIIVDSIALRYVGDNPNFYLTKKVPKAYANKIHNQTKELIARWRAAGITITFSNQDSPLAKLLPIFRRNHIKIYAVDDTVWLGGINAFDEALNFIDFMVPFTDRTIVKNVCEQFHKIDSKKPHHDYRISSPPHEIIVDAGNFGSSLIYKEASLMIRQAKANIIFASQFVPDGKLLKELIKVSQKAVQVTVITRQKSAFAHFPYNLAYDTFMRKTRYNPNIKLFHQKKKVHAKLMIIDDTVAIFGSHNLTKIGVWLGTEEIAVKTKEKQLIKSLTQFVSKYTVTK